MRTFAKLLFLGGCLLMVSAKSIDDAVVEKEEIILAEDEDAPALTDAEQELVSQSEEMQVDAKTGVRLYRGYRVVRTMPKTQAHLEALRFVSNGVDDYWTPIPANISAIADASDLHVDLMLGPRHLDQVTSYLSCQGVPFEIAIEDVQDAIDEENVPAEDEDDDEVLVGRHDYFSSSSPHSITKRQINLGSLIRNFFGFDSTRPQDLGNHPTKIREGRHFNPTPVPFDQPPPPLPPNQFQNNHPQISLIGSGLCSDKSGFKWNKYYGMDYIDKMINCLESEHPDKLSVERIGSSFEGRTLRVLKIGRNACPRHQNHRPAVWIDGGIHAREWISPSTVMYFAHQLVENYDEHADFLDCADIYIMPVVNPDGYEYTFKRDRMWRKTRSRNSNSNCVGSDPNRNWSYKWGGEGASNKPCTEIYMGSRPFSERETQAVANFVMKHRKNIKLFLTYHSYGQYILYPWGYTDRGVPPNYRNLDSLARVMDNAMDAKYTIGSAAKVLYPAAGGSDDWAKGEAKIEYSYTVELPDTGRYGFLLPARRIKDTVYDAHRGLTAMIRELVHNRVDK